MTSTRWSTRVQIALDRLELLSDPRCNELMSHLKGSNGLTSDDLCRKMGTSPAAMQALLRQMTDGQLLAAKGTGRTATYQLDPQRLARILASCRSV